jgi:hypothetical protein
LIAILFIELVPNEGKAAKARELKFTDARLWKVLSYFNMAAQPIEVSDVPTPINSYTCYYPETHWASCHVQASRFMGELEIGADPGFPQIYEDVRRDVE